MSRLEKMLAKSQDVRGTNDIPRDEVRRSDAPRTGVGLMAQLSSARVRIQELEEAAGKAGNAGMIPVDSISPNPWQPRRLFEEAEIQKLAGSIGEVGLIQPIVVRRVRNPDTHSEANESVRIPDTFQIVAGERRWRAHKSLGKADIKTVVVEVSDEEMSALALAENFDREDLTAYEIALAIRNAEANFPNRKSLAAALGINRTELYQYLAFFALPSFVIDDLEIAPALLGRDAAEDLATTIKRHGQQGIDSLQSMWPRFKAGEIDQGKVASLIESTLTRSQHVPTERDIRKLFVGKDQAGSIMRDASKLQVTIRSAALTSEKEAELRRFVESMFK